MHVQDIPMMTWVACQAQDTQGFNLTQLVQLVIPQAYSKRTKKDWELKIGHGNLAWDFGEFLVTKIIDPTLDILVSKQERDCTTPCNISKIQMREYLWDKS